MNPIYMLLVIPFFFIAMGMEWVYMRAKKKNWYRLNDSINNLVIGIGQQLWDLVFKAVTFGAFIWVYNNYSLFKIPASWWSFILCLVTFDFFFYWAHRWGHEMNIFWGAHSVHHQSEEFNLSVALRQSWFHHFLAFFIFLPIPLLGFDPVIFGSASLVQTLYQFWIHTKAINKLPRWFEYIFNTPSHHRVHHAINPGYIDKNHAGMFMIWDRMFGTFKEEEDAHEITYGITTQLKSWNPAWANLHYYVEMYQQARLMKWSDKLKMIVAKPGWLPDYMGGTQNVIEVDKNTHSKYNADTHQWFKIYAVVQFLILLAGALDYIAHFSEISTFYKVAFFLVILVTMLITGAIFENKHWIAYAEYVRLVLVMVILNTFYYFWHLSWFSTTLIISTIAFSGCIVLFTYSYKYMMAQQLGLLTNSEN